MKSRKIFTLGDLFFLLFGTIVIIIVLGTILYSSKINHDDSENELRRLYKANFLENVEFQGDILRIEKLGLQHRGRINICVKLYKLEVDSSKIIEGNPFFNLDFKVTNLVFGGFDYPKRKRLMEMNKVHLNKNDNGKLMLFSSSSDSIDATPRFDYLVNSEATEFCRDFGE